MFTQDPFQTSLGAYAAAANPFGTLHSTFQNQGINPLAVNPLAAILALQQTGQQQGYPGIQSYGGIHPQQQQQQPGILQNPLLAAFIQNQIQNQIIAALQQQQLQQQQQNPFVNPFVAQQQYGNPFAQQFGQSSLAPQSWVGQGGQPGGAQALGQQLHPLLAQLAARSIYGPSVPWGTY
jgi:hypothetical protein